MTSAGPARAWLHRAERAGQAAETFCLVAVLGAMIMLAAAQIMLRNVWGISFGWADEALRVMVLWLAMLGGVAASREYRHISIDLLSRYAPLRLRRWCAGVADAFTALVCFSLAWHSYVFVADSYAAQEKLLGGLPAWSLQVILPLGFGLIGYRYGIWVLRRLRFPERGMPAR